MELLLAAAVAVLFATGLYMMLRRSLIKIILGLGLLSNGANLLIFSAAGLVRGAPPVIPGGATELAANSADPLPQALILTAIVITFGVQAFALVLVYRSYQEVGSDDPDDMTLTDDPDAEMTP
jgi:multicomponent Na+:H+ antiporter subunit C